MKGKIGQILSSVGLIVVIAFVVRIVFLFIFYQNYGEPSALDKVPFGAETGSVAASIAGGQGFSSPLHETPSGPTAWFTPIFPYLLAGIFKLCGTFSYLSGLIIRTLDLAFSAFTCWPIFTIGTKVFGKATGRIAAWTWVICPAAIYFPLLWVWDTALTGLWVTLLISATLALRGSANTRHWVGYGALWGVGVMINPSMLSVLPFLALWAIWPLRQTLQQAAKLTLAASLIFLACILPWTVRNYVVFHKFMPLRSNFGLELWLGNNAEAPPSLSPQLHPYENPPEAAKYFRMTEIPYMQAKQSEALAFMRSHPFDTVHSIFMRFEQTWLGMWDSPVDVWSHAPLSAKLTILWNCSLSLLALLGVLFAHRTGKKEGMPFAIVMLVFPLVFYFTHTTLRYRYPIDPVMQVLAAYAVVYLVSKVFAYLRGFASTPLEVSARRNEL